MKKIMILLVLVIGAIIVTGCSNSSITGNGTLDNGDGAQVTLYKSQSCGCCSGYVKYLEKQSDFNVNVVEKQDVADIKTEYGVPSNLRSCHTMIVGDYFVEGHVPLEAVNKLLEEKPDIAGIALSGMPSGTPGMPGSKTETWVIYSIDKEGNIEEFMKI